jgi:pentatricopeptide repeat protein
MALIPIPQTQKPLPNLPGPVLDTERRPTMDTRTVQRAAIALGASTKQPEVPTSLAKPYEALSEVGSAVAKVGNLFTTLAIKTQEARTDRQAIEFDAAATNAEADEIVWRETTKADPATWEEHRAATMQKLKADTFSKDLTPQAREQIDLRFIRHDAQSRARTAMASSTKTFDMSKNAHVGLYIEHMRQGRFDEAYEVIDLMEEKKLLQPDEGGKMRVHLDSEKKRQTAETEILEAEAIVRRNEDEIMDNPSQWLKDHPTAKGYEPEMYQKLRTMAEGVLADKQRVASEKVSEDIFNNVIKTPEAIRKRVDPDLTPQIRVEAEKVLINYQQLGQYWQTHKEQGARNYVKYLHAAEAYDPAKDPELVEYFKIVSETAQYVHPTMAPDVINTLKAKRGARPVSEEMRSIVEKNISKEIHKDFDPAFYSRKVTQKIKGHWRTWTEVYDPLKKEMYEDAEAELHLKMQEWYQANPDKVNNIAEATRYLQHLKDTKYGMQRAAMIQQQKKKGWIPRDTGAPVLPSGGRTHDKASIESEINRLFPEEPGEEVLPQ